MDDRSGYMRDLEDALARLGPRLGFPAERDLSGAVRARIEAGSGAERRRVSWRPALAVATVLVGLTAGVLVFSPATRDAVADWIGLDGVRITYDDEVRAPIAEDLLLGDRVTLEEAEDQAGFDVETLGALGAPDEVYVRSDRPGGRVSLVYEAAPGLPRTAETGVGALFGQFEATYDVDIAQKKMLGERSTLEAVEVAGARGYWLGGGPHTVVFIDPNGEMRADEVRLAGNTLLWQRGGIVFRLETALSRDEAVALAESSL